MSKLEWCVGTTFARGLMVPPIDWFPDVFPQDEFKIVDNHTEASLVNIQYDYQPAIKSNNQLLRGGNLNLMPENFWLIKNGTVVLEDPDGNVQAEIECEYDFSSENAPRLLHQQVRLVEHDQTIERHYSNYRKVGNVDKNIFYLTCYQFPEPDFGDKAVNRLRYIVMIAGLCLIGFGAWRINQKRRKKLEA